MAKAYTFSESGAKRVVNATRYVESIPRGQFASPTRNLGRAGDVIWAKIISSASLAAGKWTYTVKPMVGGDATSHTGLKEYTTETFTAYNAAEKGTNAAYVNANVTGILAIPNGEEMLCTFVNRNGTLVLIFRERNEPTCA